MIDTTRVDNVVIEGMSAADDHADAFIYSADYNGEPMTVEQIDELDDDFMWAEIYKDLF